MTRHDVDTVPGDLAGMDEIPANARRTLNDRDDLYAGLHQLVADDEADVARADHQDLVARLDTVNVHQRLCSSCPEDARHVVVLEHQHLLGCACGDNNLAGVEEDRMVLVGGTDVSMKPAKRSEPAVDSDAGGRSNFFNELLCNSDTARTSILLRRTEELVRLLDQLTTQLGILVQQRDMCASFGRPERRFQTCRPAADDQDFCVLLLDALYRRLDVRELAVAMLRLDFHAIPNLQDAGASIGDAVDAHHAR